MILQRIKITLITFSSLILFTTIVLLIVFGIEYKTQLLVKSNATKFECTIYEYNTQQQESYKYYDNDVWVTVPPKCYISTNADCINFTHVRDLNCYVSLCNNTQSINDCIKEYSQPVYNVYTFQRDPSKKFEEIKFNKLIKKYYYSDRMPNIIVWLVVLVLSIGLIVLSSLFINVKN